MIEEKTAQRRSEVACLLTELEAERECEHRVEIEDAQLRTEMDEVTEKTAELRHAAEMAVNRNGTLEAECSEATEERLQAQKLVEMARQRLHDRGAALGSLRGAVRDHAKMVAERLELLEESLVEVPSSSQTSSNGSARKNARQAQRTPPETIEVPNVGRGSPNDPTLLYPAGTHDVVPSTGNEMTVQERALEECSAQDQKVRWELKSSPSNHIAKRRRIPAEEDHTDLKEVQASLSPTIRMDPSASRWVADGAVAGLECSSPRHQS